MERLFFATQTLLNATLNVSFHGITHIFPPLLCSYPIIQTLFPWKIQPYMQIKTMSSALSNGKEIYIHLPPSIVVASTRGRINYLGG